MNATKDISAETASAVDKASSNNRRIALGLFAAALILRLIFIYNISDMPTFDQPLMDEGYHIQLTDDILSGELLPKSPFYRAPLYPYSLALLRLATDDNLFAVRVIQATLGSLLPVILFLFGMRMFRRKVALTAAIIAVFYPTFIYYDASLLITSLMTILSVLVVWQTLRAERRPTLGRFVGLGLLIGLTALARPNVLFYLPALSLWFWFVIRQQFHNKLTNALVSYVFVVFSAIVVIAPVTVHNWVTSGEFIPISWQGGYNFYLGNNHQATGWSATAPGIQSSWQGGYLDAINIAQTEAGRRLNEKEIDEYWWGRGWDEVRERPGATFTLFLKKLRFLVNGFEIPNNQSLYIVEPFSPIAEALFARTPLFVPFGLVAPFALLGLFFIMRRAREHLPLLLFIASYSLSMVLFFVCTRYRQPLIPFAILLGAYGFYELLDMYKCKKWKSFAPYMLALIGLFVFTNYDFVGIPIERQLAGDHCMLGKSYQDQRDFPNAEREYESSLKAYPGFLDAHINLGLMAAARQDAVNAERHFLAVLRAEPNNSLALTNLAVSLMQRDEYTESQQLLERALKISPIDYNIHYRLGLVYHLQEHYELARQKYNRVLQLNPGFKPAMQNLRIVEDVLVEDVLQDSLTD